MVGDVKRLVIYWAIGCEACEEALQHLAAWHPKALVAIDRRSVNACDWKLPGGKPIRVTPTYLLTDARGAVIAMHEGVLSLGELGRFTKQELKLEEA